MQTKTVVKLFEDLYEIYFDLKEKDFMISFLKTKPTLNEFEDFCWSWKIDYEIKKIKIGDN
jgi:hypothetical protein